MRFGIVILPEHPWATAQHLWRRAEQYGFDHAWTYDHLSWRTLANQPWGATIPTLTAAATVTATIRLGTFVSSPNFRHPVPFAKEVATVDDISSGRFILGVGSGGTGFDAFVLGQQSLTPRERHARFVEFVEQLDQLLRFEHDGAISCSGEWYSAHEARMVGTPAQTPRLPFVIAANGPKGLDLVARYGQGWVSTGREGVTGDAWWSGIAELGSRLDDAANARGRVPEQISRYLSLDSGGQFALASVNAFDDAVARAAELGFTDVVMHWPRPEGIYRGSESVLEDVAARMMELRCGR